MIDRPRISNMHRRMLSEATSQYQKNLILSCLIDYLPDKDLFWNACTYVPCISSSTQKYQMSTRVSMSIDLLTIWPANCRTESLAKISRIETALSIILLIQTLNSTATCESTPNSDNGLAGSILSTDIPSCEAILALKKLKINRDSLTLRFRCSQRISDHLSCIRAESSPEMRKERSVKISQRLSFFPHAQSSYNLRVVCTYT